MFFKYTKKAAKRAVSFIEDKIERDAPTWSSRENNRRLINKNYATKEDIEKELNKITRINEKQFDNLYKSYNDSKKVNYWSFSATDELVKEVKEINNTSLPPDKEENNIAKAISTYLKNKSNHELGFCEFLLNPRMSTLQSYSLRLESQEESKRELKAEEKKAEEKKEELKEETKVNSSISPPKP